MRLFCFGLGYVAKALAAKLAASAWQIDGTTRSGGGGFAFSGNHALCAEGREALAGATHVLISIPPDAEGGDPAQALADENLLYGKWIGYLSTTGVYGDWRGAWVDETSPLQTKEPRSISRKQAENFWYGKGASVFRLAGIYGPGRNAIVSLMKGQARRIHKPGQVFSRIHVDDIAIALAVAMAKDVRGAIYNLADDLPCSQADVVAYAAELTGMEPPPLIPFDEAGLSPMAQSFYAENRRVKNDRLKMLLGGALRYPSYKEGLQVEWKAIQSEHKIKG